MEQNREISLKFRAPKICNPDDIRTKSDKIWHLLSGHKWLTAIRVPHLYSGVLCDLPGGRFIDLGKPYYRYPFRSKLTLVSAQRQSYPCHSVPSYMS